MNIIINVNFNHNEIQIQTSQSLYNEVLTVNNEHRFKLFRNWQVECQLGTVIFHRKSTMHYFLLKAKLSQNVELRNGNNCRIFTVHHFVITEITDRHNGNNCHTFTVHPHPYQNFFVNAGKLPPPNLINNCFYIENN